MARAGLCGNVRLQHGSAPTATPYARATPLLRRDGSAVILTPAVSSAMSCSVFHKGVAIMASKTCPQCAEKVQSAAKVCRHCGNAFPEPSAKPAKSGWGFWKVVGVVLGVTFLFSLVVSSRNPKGVGGVPTDAASDNSSEAAETVDQAQEAARKVRAAGAVMSIMNSAREPASVTFEHVYVNKEATITCVEYSGRNGFGGMNRETVAFDKSGKPRQSASFWNKNCTSEMFEMKGSAEHGILGG